jgi:flagellar basal body rod protein FlgG
MAEINGMRQAAHALRYWEVRQQAVANNLANVSTDGFKAERVFARMLEGEDPIPFADAATDFRSGTFRVTDQPLDLALEGDGFFVVQTPEGERLTRGGSFQLDQENRIVDSSGNPILGDAGPVIVPTETFEIDRLGVLRVGGEALARLRIESVPAGERLQHQGGNLFIPGESRQTAEAGSVRVRQGAVEESNVSSVGALVDMITIQRAYSAIQRAVQTLDGVHGTISSEIARSG